MQQVTGLNGRYGSIADISSSGAAATAIATILIKSSC